MTTAIAPPSSEVALDPTMSREELLAIIRDEQEIARAARRRAERRALKEQKRRRATKRAVRKAGAATQEAYAMAERFQDVIAQAQREGDDPERSQALAAAAEHFRKGRDEIVRALGVE
jgi:hypothetical protein